MAECRGCKQKIKWVEMASGKKMPLDEKPVSMIDVKDGIGAVVEVFTPHWATCPQANDFKKKR